MATPLPASDPDEIVNTRQLAQPRTAVFAAFSDPVRLASWWGPRGFTNVFHAFEFRPGGTWRFTMRGPDGATYELQKEFVEIIAPERIGLRHRQAGHGFTLAMIFAARDGGTELTWRMRFDDPAEGVRVRDFVLRANEENFDRLAAHLSGGDVVIR